MTTGDRLVSFAFWGMTGIAAILLVALLITAGKLDECRNLKGYPVGMESR